MSNATADHPHNSDDRTPVSEDTFSNGIKDRQNTYEKCRMNPPEYSQVAPIDVIGPSPMV